MSAGTDEEAEPRARRFRWGEGERPVLVTVLSLFCAAVIGSILIAVADEETRTAMSYFFAYPWDTFTAAGKAIGAAWVSLFEGAILRPSALASGNPSAILAPISETLVSATPLILGGLSVALAFRAGLLNIGGQGQIIAGAVAAAFVGFHWHMPVGIHLVAALAAGIVGGAIWGGIAGLLKARTGAHEVISTIMLNYVALYSLAYLLNVKGFQAPPYGQAISNNVDETARFPPLFTSSLRVNLSLVLALLAAVGVWWLLTRSSLGFRLRAVGANQHAARTAGMNVGRSYIWVMLLAGALSGMAGCAQILGTNPAVTNDIDAGIGFDAITVALLGRSKPGPTVMAGLLFGALRAGSVQMQSSTGTPVDLVQVVQSLIVLFIAAPALVRAVFRFKGGGGSLTQELAKGWSS
ncbi:MAG TPA: ABC transporter permease [Segeticoccus sp.]|nr:ABC transporter permease [Segeticoccus sp.]